MCKITCEMAAVSEARGCCMGHCAVLPACHRAVSVACLAWVIGLKVVVQYALWRVSMIMSVKKFCPLPDLPYLCTGKTTRARLGQVSFLSRGHGFLAVWLQRRCALRRAAVR